MNPKLTPEIFLSAPRRSPALPNEDGTLALYSVSTYSFDSHSESKEEKILHLKSGLSILLTDDPKITEVHWLKGIQVLWLKAVDGGATEIWIGNALGEKEAYLAGKIDGPINTLKLADLDDSSVAVVFVARASPDGTLHNPEKAPKAHSSAREYDTGNVRLWDHYYELQRNALFYTTLESSEEGRYKLDVNGVVNALEGTGLECPFPDGLSDAAATFDISGHGGLIFSCMDTPAATEFRFSLYHVALSTFKEESAEVTKIEVDGFNGSTSDPVFSPDGKSFAFTLGKNVHGHQRLFVADSKSLEARQLVIDDWDRSPGSLLWGNDGNVLYASSEDSGRVRIFKIVLPTSAASSATLIAITSKDASVSSVKPLTKASDDHRLLVTRSNYSDSSIYEILDAETVQTELISTATNHGATFGLDASQVSEIHFKGDGDYQVQAFIMKPSHFNKNKKYPLAFIVHGGPQSAWDLSWSTRWNPAMYAEQGYVVVLPNPTGSTGFGEEFSNAVLGDWGGRPYRDLVNCFEHVKEELSFVDTSRAVALGASYGGYMMNWFAGQKLSKEFKALVCHDGIFSAANLLASDVVATLSGDFGKPIWEKDNGWDKHDPSRYTHNWTVPTLFIHSDMDYRCPTTEGWAAYAVLQGKGIESRYLNFPDECHFVLKPENSLRWCKSVLGWINKFAGVKDGIQLEPALTEPRPEKIKSRVVGKKQSVAKEDQ